MASTWVEKQHIFIKYNPKAWNKSGTNLGRRILCLQKSGAKMAFFEVFANFDIFKDKKYHFHHSNDQNLPGQVGTSIIEAIYAKKSASIILAPTPP